MITPVVTGRPMFSIQRFLMLTLMLVVSGFGLALIGVTFYQAYHEVDELFDAELARNARLLGVMISASDDLDPTVLLRSGAGHEYERYLAFQHWSSGGELLLSGGGVPQEPLAPLVPGFSEQEIDGRRWHVFALNMPEEGWLLVGEQAHIRDELTRNTAVTLTLPYVLAIPVILLLVTVALRRGLRPMKQLAASIQRRGDRNLRPLGTGANVRELRPVVEALNHLLRRLDEALAREQRFTADAAHELRTLLAVLKLHSDNARHLGDPQEARESLEQLSVGVERASRMVAQLLVLARLDPEQGDSLRRETRLAPVAREVLASLDPLAETRGQRLELDSAAESLRAAISPEALEILLRNLVENALRYSPAGGAVEVVIRDHGDAVEIRVLDDGEGVPEALADRVRERFFRASREGNGVGLGLAIVTRILELAGGQLSFVPRAKGQRAAAVVTLPAA